MRLLTVVVVLGGVDACRWRQDAMTPARRSLPPCTNVLKLCKKKGGTKEKKNEIKRKERKEEKYNNKII